MVYEIIVVGAGPAGLLAAWHAASQGARVLLLEKNPQAGRKLLLTGAGRCNLTNQDQPDDFVAGFYGKGRFLYPAIKQFFRPELLAFLARQGLHCQSDDQGRYHPASQKAADVLAALLAACRSAGVIFRFAEPVLSIQTEGPEQASRVTGVQTKKGLYQARAVILACGGSSYPRTGSAGDGYRLAAAAGHKIIQPRPGLVALDCAENWISGLSGISLPDVGLTISCCGQQQARTRGSLLFTHHGVSGPAILRISRFYNPGLGQKDWQLEMDLLPGLSFERLYQLLDQGQARQVDSSMQNILANTLALPRRLAGSILDLLALSADHSAGLMGQKQLRRLAAFMQEVPLSLEGTRGFGQAMVTVGGLDLAQIDPRTMMSRLVHGLYAAGELLDLDGDSGGYNLQAAFSTGWLAAHSAARQVDLPRDLPGFSAP